MAKQMERLFHHNAKLLDILITIINGRITLNSKVLGIFTS